MPINSLKYLTYPARFEPATPRLGILYSIRLSYGYFQGTHSRRTRLPPAGGLGLRVANGRRRRAVSP